jgi:hypothetical protein
MQTGCFTASGWTSVATSSMHERDRLIYEMGCVRGKIDACRAEERGGNSRLGSGSLASLVSFYDTLISRCSNIMLD